MDESNARRRRGVSHPGLERLEGRRLMAAALTQVGIREVAKAGYTELDLSGTNKGDTVVIDDNGSGTSGNLTIRVAGGATYTSHAAIAVVKFQGGSGADNVTYNLNGTMTSAESILVDLSGGSDRFTANIHGALTDSKGLDLEVMGGLGNDALTVNQDGATEAGAFVPYLDGGAGNDTLSYKGTGTIGSGASVTPELTGGAGNDTIKANYSGQIVGNFIYNLSADGGAGNDTMTYDIHVGAGSSGSVGTSPSTLAGILGGSGNDTIRYAVTVDPSVTLAEVNAAVIGGSGKDVVSRTANVLVDKSAEKVLSIA